MDDNEERIARGIAMYGDTNAGELQERLVCEKLLAELVRMIERSNPTDDHGHPLKNSVVFLKAKEFVGEK